jgi:hypothetical protein
LDRPKPSGILSTSQVHGARDQTWLHNIPAHDHLEEACHSLIIVEHDPMLYEDSAEMVEYIQPALKQAPHETPVLLYSPGIDPFLVDLDRGADRVFYFEEGPKDTPRLTAKRWLKIRIIRPWRHSHDLWI